MRQPLNRRPLAAGTILLLCVLPYTLSCSPWRFSAEKDVVRNGIRFEAFRETKDGSKLGVLAEDTVIDGWPCSREFIVFSPDWSLDELHLFRDYERNGIPMPAGTRVFPNDQGNPGACIFPHDVEIQGYSCRGSRWGWKTSFYPSGSLKYFYSRRPVAVEGVLCKAGLTLGISLHENGRLHKCPLAEATTIAGIEYPKGALLRLNPNGRTY